MNQLKALEFASLERAKLMFTSVRVMYKISKGKSLCNVRKLEADVFRLEQRKGGQEEWTNLTPTPPSRMNLESMRFKWGPFNCTTAGRCMMQSMQLDGAECS